jgi:hypothetical protein
MLNQTESPLTKAGQKHPAGFRLGVLLVAVRYPELLALEQPHEALANLHGDEAAIRQFTDRWGKLLAPGKAAILGLGAIQEGPGIAGDYQHPALNLQKALRAAWTGNPFALQVIHDSVTRDMKTTWDFRDGQLQVAADDLWSTICILFLRDHAANRTAICENPDCRAPFVKGRATQKFCGAAECAQYAQRKAALAQWYRPGGGLAKRKKVQTRKRKPR